MSEACVPGLEFVILFVCFHVVYLFVFLLEVLNIVVYTVRMIQSVLGSLLCCGKWSMDQVNLLTWFLSLCFVSCFFSSLGRRNASRVFQMQLCVFGKGNQVLLRIMICRLWYSYSGMIRNKMFFLLSAIKILARKPVHWSTVNLHCQFSQLLMRWVLRLITCSLMTIVCFSTHYYSVSNNIMLQFFIYTWDLPFSYTVGWLIAFVCVPCINIIQYYIILYIYTYIYILI